MVDQRKRDFVKAIINVIEVENGGVIENKFEWERILIEAPDLILLTETAYGSPDTVKIKNYVKGKLSRKII